MRALVLRHKLGPPRYSLFKDYVFGVAPPSNITNVLGNYYEGYAFLPEKRSQFTAPPNPISSDRAGCLTVSRNPTAPPILTSHGYTSHAHYNPPTDYD